MKIKNFEFNGKYAVPSGCIEAFKHLKEVQTLDGLKLQMDQTMVSLESNTCMAQTMDSLKSQMNQTMVSLEP